jgi:hypothetical protein
MDNNEILDLDLNRNPNPYARRRDMLPMWIKIFTWIFLIMGCFAPIGLVVGLLKIPFSLSLYGLDTNSPISLVGFILTALFALKGVTAYGLWTEQDWAIKLAKIDAIIGVFMCIISMFGVSSIIMNGIYQIRYSFRLEFFVFIPYWRLLSKIQDDWESFS